MEDAEQKEKEIDLILSIVKELSKEQLKEMKYYLHNLIS